MNSLFQIAELELQGVKLVTPFCMEDERGYFLKSMERDVFRDWGLDSDFYEDFETYSKKGVIRGMHFQTNNPQMKVVRVIRGVVHDIIIDLRKESNTFGKYVDVILSDENRNILCMPKGFAHGFEVLSEDAIMSYKCVGKYLKEYDTGICYNDVDLALPWQTKIPIVSEKDANLMTFQTFVKEFGGL